MLYVMVGVFAFMLGALVAWHDEEGCPNSVLGYDCQGSRCDHRKSVLYKTKATMALQDEKRQAKLEREKMLKDQA